jgi:hypothetical protein
MEFWPVDMRPRATEKVSGKCEGAIPSHLSGSGNADEGDCQDNESPKDEAQTASIRACLPLLVFSALSCRVENRAIIGNILDSHFLTTFIS